MFSLFKPSPERLRAFLDAQSKLELTYRPTDPPPADSPAGYVVDHTRTRLGRCEETFEAGREALRHWRQLRLGWLEVYPHDAPIRVGQPIAIVGRSLGTYWTNACQIVRLADEDDGAIRRWGFTYGTLPDHAGTGEERFLVEWDRRDDVVSYDIFAFSRPHGLHAKVGYPWLRRLQKQFGRDSTAAVRRAVESSLGRTLKQPEPLEARRI